MGEKESRVSKLSKESMARMKLIKVVTKKLVSKYNGGDQGGETLTKCIEGKVSLFLGQRSSISERDLVSLERSIQELVGKRIKPSSGPASPSPSTGTKRPSSAASRQSSDASARSCRSTPSSSASAATRKSLTKKFPHELIPIERLKAEGYRLPVELKNDWLIMETYNILQNDKKAAKEAAEKEKKIQMCKRDLELQMQQNDIRRKRDAEEEAMYAREQAQLQEQHLRDLEYTKKKVHERLLKEKKVREFQMEENGKRRNREKEEQALTDAATVKKSHMYLEMERALQAQKVSDRRAQLREMFEENKLNRKILDKRAAEEAENDIRLMREYKERLEREEQRRRDDSAKRLSRYEEIGQLWEKKGAGKAQREAELTQEKKILTEAAAKEKADADREIRDKRVLLENRLRCQKFNETLVAEKDKRKKAELEEEQKYAMQFRKEGAAYLAEQQAKEAKELRRKQTYGVELMEDVAEVRARAKNVLMSEKERGVNGVMLRHLTEHPDVMLEIGQRISGEALGGKDKVQALRAVPTIGAP